MRSVTHTSTHYVPAIADGVCSAGVGFRQLASIGWERGMHRGQRCVPSSPNQLRVVPTRPKHGFIASRGPRDKDYDQCLLHFIESGPFFATCIMCAPGPFLSRVEFIALLANYFAKTLDVEDCGMAEENMVFWRRSSVFLFLFALPTSGF
jgi:hypothetical protein